MGFGTSPQPPKKLSGHCTKEYCNGVSFFYNPLKFILMKNIFFSLFLLTFLSAQSQTTIMVGSTLVEVDTVYTGLDIPWEIIYGPDNHIWTTERKGIISRIDPVTGTKTVILNLTATVYQASESGLLGMALHPDFPNTPEVFVAYTYNSSGFVKERFVKYTYNGTALVSPVTLIEDITGNTTHIGARFQFLPDTTLLVSTGDAQNTSLPQNLNSLSGKVLRMNTDGTIPADNPNPSSYVYSYGHRNVQGVLRAPNGIIYLSEHGASSDDEFQILEPNRNYGWPNVEGFCDLPGEQSFCTSNNVKEPLTAWTPTIAPSDMVWYENPNFPEFDGKILMTVLKDKKLVAIELDQNGTQYISQTHYLTNLFGRLRDICVGPNKEIYLATNGASWSNTNPNTHSIIRLKVDNPSNIHQINSGNIKLYPNPVSEMFQIEVNESLLGAEYLVRDITGRILANGQINGTPFQISSAFLPKGVYELSIIQNQKWIEVLKFVK